MDWVATSRLLSALERLTPNKKVSLIAKEKENYNAVDFFTLLSMDLATVNIGSAKVKKFITKSFDLSVLASSTTKISYSLIIGISIDKEISFNVSIILLSSL